MPDGPYLTSGAPESEAIATIATITALRGADYASWQTANDDGSSDGAFMLVIVHGPSYIADLQVAVAALKEKWDAAERQREAEAADEAD